MPVLMSALRKSPAEQEKWVPGKEIEYVYDQVRIFAMNRRAS
jgi:leukotriene-A4 hydrolase